ncbi:MAG TPA: lanthionine synthetase C family protein [Thermoanaerobaculia bacterium]|nr:lanthionine synthetase C family protein [Thermoanaerobaculia bacterium]
MSGQLEDDASPSVDASSSWRPLFSGDAAERALGIAEEIAAAIGPSAQVTTIARPGYSGAWSLDHRDFSLAGGNAGIAVFLSYLDAARPGGEYGEWALWHLEQAIDAIRQTEAQPLLYSGFPGVAWALEHLNGRLFEDDGTDLGEEAAMMVADYLGQSPWQRHFDLIAGLVGLGVYGLERLPRAHGQECLVRTVARLAEIAEHQEQAITWKTERAWLAPQEVDLYSGGNYNLGVSHGVPGVIAFLGEALAALGSPEARVLLSGAVAWLLAQKLPADSPSNFPSSVAPGSTPIPTRISWCYGDLGISLALLGAARRADEASWEAEALAVARSAAGRPFDRAGVIEPGLCHGAAGAAHLFNRLFQATGDPVFAKVARGWFERTYSLRRTDGGLAGFSAWLPGASGELCWRDEPGLLTGVAGVGLALLAAATPVEPAWDRMLLVSVPG